MKKDGYKPLSRIIQLILTDRKDIVSIYFFAIMSGLVQLSLPLGVQAIISFVLGATMVTSIYVLIFVIVLGVFLVGAFQINQLKIIEKIQQNIFVRNTYLFAEVIPQIDLMKSNNYYLPEKITRFFDVMSVQKGISKLLLDIPIASIQIIFGLLLLSFYHPIFIAFGFLLLLFLVLILWFTGKKGIETNYVVSTHKYEVAAWFGEIGRVVKSFKFRHGTHLNISKADEKSVKYINARTKHFSVLLLQYKALVLFKVLITVTMLAVGTYLLLEQKLNIGEFIAAEIVILSIIGAVEKLIGSISNVYDVITGLEKLSSVTESPLEKSGKVEFKSINSGVSVELTDCNITYPNNKTVLKNMNFKIPSNSIVGITGCSGSGKTSLLNLLSGNLGDDNGGVLINNIALGNYNLESLRKKMGVFLFNTDVFEGTVLENITMGRQGITQEEITKLAYELGFSGFIQSLKNGFETEVDPAGKKMSTTSVQIILLLRAFIEKPDFLLLEEPWNNFNKELKDSFIDYIFNKMEDTTLVIATNDSSYLEKVDIVLELHKGEVLVSKNK
jgi:ABC-type bacteriocin/lantibiotic exporter with double-glycine peptidase domain